MKKLHFWLSLPSGLFITLICLTGAIMVFQQELLEIFNKERYFTGQNSGNPLPLDNLVATVNTQLQEDTITAVKIYARPGRCLEATLRSGARSYVYINPYTAEITGYYNARSGFFHKVMALHRWLMLPGRETGRLIVGISTLCLIVILITGIIRWWGNRSFQIKRKASAARKIYDLHRIPGIYTAVLLLVCSLSGLMWSFGWYRQGVAQLFRIETGQSSKETKKEKPVSPESSFSWQNACEAALAGIPDFNYMTLYPDGTVTVFRKGAIHPRATEHYRYAPEKNSITLVSGYGANRNQSYMMGWAYVIHTGSWGGAVTRWLTFFAALTGASLPVTGYILYFRRKLRRKR